MMADRTLKNVCEWCGIVHIKQHHCKYDLHGEADFMKACCAACEDEIGPNEPRAGDKYGNLYCGDTCQSLGLAILRERLGELQ